MIHKLRQKFILVASACILLILSIVIIFMNVISYYSGYKEAMSILSYILDHNGRMPDKNPLSRDVDFFVSRELRFETRYFSIITDINGNYINSDNEHIYAVTDKEAETMYMHVLAKKQIESTVRWNKLTSIDVRNNTELTRLWCHGNKLTKLDIRKCKKIYTDLSTDDDVVVIRSTPAFKLTGTKGKNKEEVAALKKIFEKIDWHNAYGKFSDNLNNRKYFSWDKNGRLTGLNLTSYYHCENLSLSDFPELVYFSCTYSWLNDLDVSKNTKLKYLDCEGNYLTSLNLSNNTELEGLYCSSNRLKRLKISSKANLTELDCSANRLKKLDLKKFTNLKELSCSWNKLTELDLSSNTKLEELYCHNNRLKELDLSSNTKLKQTESDFEELKTIRFTGTEGKNKEEVAALKNIFKKIDWNGANSDFSSNLNNKKYFKWDKNGSLTSLNLTSYYDSATLSLSAFPELTAFSCSYSGLTSLDVSKNKRLKELDCEGNRLTTLNLSGNEKLEKLNCANNRLTVLNINSKANLTELDCSVNRLRTLDLKNSTNLKELSCSWNKLTALDLSSNAKLEELHCYNNRLKKINVSKCSKLATLSCENNKLEKLDISKNKKLKRIESDFEQLNTIDGGK